jgi:3-hydroxyisobutyrate dehydrogenase-like beta-hydroxyacid dehydrogenase
MRIGFVGLGAMGFGMATNLVAAGHALRVIAHRNREALEKLVTDGARE